MRFIIRTIAAGVVSMAARIIIKKIQERDQADSPADGSDRPNPVEAPAE